MACSPTVSGDEPLVFPPEARLGATAAILIDSNYIKLADEWEFYDLKSDRIEIFLEDASSAQEQATVRQVFDLEASSWSRYAATSPGAWVTVALFDLPQSGLSTGPASVTVEIDGGAATRVGTIEILGSGGVPTNISFPSTAESAETLLESKPTLRLRAIRAEEATDPGFDDEWLIGGIEFDVEYVPCVDMRAFPDSEAAGATAIIGPPSPGAAWHVRRHVVMVDPNGFQLKRPNNFWGLSSPTSAGQGPFLTIALDRGGALVCTELVPAHFKIENLHVTDVDGETLIDERGEGDSTDYVDVIVVDTEATSS
jgi:hypothetical protein